METHLHREEYRIRCRNCQTEFCFGCNSIPYHLGYTCQQFEKYLKSKKCRFCESDINHSSPHFKFDCCEEEDCISKHEIGCKELLGCGHFCSGVDGETKHLDCLHQDCEDISPLGDKADDYCNFFFIFIFLFFVFFFLFYFLIYFFFILFYRQYLLG